MERRFPKRLFGYNSKDVEEKLSTIIAEQETSLVEAENSIRQLREEKEKLSNQFNKTQALLSNYQVISGSIFTALEKSRLLANEIIKTAGHKSELILAEGQKRAESHSSSLQALKSKIEKTKQDFRNLIEIFQDDPGFKLLPESKPEIIFDLERQELSETVKYFPAERFEREPEETEITNRKERMETNLFLQLEASDEGDGLIMQTIPLSVDNSHNKFILTEKIILSGLPLLAIVSIIIPLFLGQPNLTLLGIYLAIPMFFSPIVYLLLNFHNKNNDLNL